MKTTMTYTDEDYEYLQLMHQGTSVDHAISLLPTTPEVQTWIANSSIALAYLTIELNHHQSPTESYILINIPRYK